MTAPIVQRHSVQPLLAQASTAPLAAILAVAITAGCPAAARAHESGCHFQGATYAFEASPGAAVATLSGVRDRTPDRVEHQPYTADQLRGLLVALEIGTQTGAKGYESAADNQPECLKQQARSVLAVLLGGRSPPGR